MLCCFGPYKQPTELNIEYSEVFLPNRENATNQKQVPVKRCMNDLFMLWCFPNPNISVRGKFEDIFTSGLVITQVEKRTSACSIYKGLYTTLEGISFCCNGPKSQHRCQNKWQEERLVFLQWPLLECKMIAGHHTLTHLCLLSHSDFSQMIIFTLCITCPAFLVRCYQQHIFSFRINQL